MDKTSNDGGLEENLADVFIDMIVMKTDEVDSKLNPRRVKNSDRLPLASFSQTDDSMTTSLVEWSGNCKNGFW